jgi:hypothetical protein
MNMSENLTAFQIWTLAEFERITAEYRLHLHTVVKTCKEWAEGCNWEQRHTDAGIECLRPVPEMSSYSGGAVSGEERLWYMQIRKPDWNDFRNDAIKTLTALVGNTSIQENGTSTSSQPE